MHFAFSSCFNFVVLTGMLARCSYPTWPGHRTVKGYDGTPLSVYSEQPLTLPGSKQTFPLVVFVNSWGVPGIEYLVKTIQWAAKGYICVEYEARGWYGSGGKIDVGGPDDVKDAQSIIDWALREFPQADPAAIAMGGISYGSQISQMTAAADARVRAVLAMSGTSNALDDLYWQKSVSQAWGFLLVNTGKWPIGREEPYVNEVYQDLLKHENLTYVTKWAQNRSMTSFIDQLNANKPAFYMSHQHQDNLFHSSVELHAWEQLQTPKKLDLSQGTHASAELLGLVDLDNLPLKTAAQHIWGNALRWLDRWLKGVQNGVDTEAFVQMQLGGDGALAPYQSFPTWPPTESDKPVWRLMLGSRGASKYGSLSEASESAGIPDQIRFTSSLEKNPMNTGVLGISDMFKVIAPISAKLDKVDPSYGIVYSGPVHEASTRLCGSVKLSGLSVIPSAKQFQLVAFLYSFDGKSTGDLITHSTRTVWPEDGATVGSAFVLQPMEFHTVCYDIPKGHKLALGLSLYDYLYKPANKSSSLTLTVSYASSPMLEVTVVNVARDSDESPLMPMIV